MQTWTSLERILEAQQCNFSALVQVQRQQMVEYILTVAKMWLMKKDERAGTSDLRSC